MWRDLAWVLDILQASRKALDYARGLSEEQFGASSLHQDAIIRQLTIVGEAAKRVTVEFRVNHHGIPWRHIAGFRVFQALGLPAIQSPPFVLVVQFSQNPHKLIVVQRYSDLLICVDRIISLQQLGQEASIIQELE
jgi:uncharacterized protein with HEPN domain